MSSPYGGEETRGSGLPPGPRALAPAALNASRTPSLGPNQPQPVIACNGEVSERSSTSSRDRPAKLRLATASSHRSQVPSRSPLALSMTMQAGSQSGMPRACSERSYARFEQSSHREAPNEGLRPHAVQIHLERLSAYRRRAAAFFFGWCRASITAQGPQTGAPSKVDTPQRPQQPASRRNLYCLRSSIRRFCKTRLATGTALHGDSAPATDTESGERAGLSPIAAAPAPLTASGADSFATVLETGLPGAAVSLALGGPAFFAADPAQPPSRLVGVETALGAQPAREPFIGTLAGAPVLGLAGLGIAHAFDAGVPAFRGPGPFRGTSLAVARCALTATGLRRVAPATRTTPTREPLGGPASGALPLVLSAPLEIGIGHGALLGSWETPSDGRRGVRRPTAAQRLCRRSPHRLHAE